MKRSIIVGIVTACLVGCTTSRLASKPWHTSPSRDHRMSTAYPFAEWTVIQKLTPGMPATKAKEFLHDLQSYHHPINAIVFTKHKGQEYEVALKLSKDKTIIEDISCIPVNYEESTAVLHKADGRQIRGVIKYKRASH